MIEFFERLGKKIIAKHEPMKFGSAGNSDVSQRQAKTINKTIDFPE
jgi:hypothetical protein